MNTTAKGDAFELKVKRKIEEMLAQNEFSIVGKYYRVFHKKAYYSEKRKRNIVVDLSIEFRRTKKSEPSIYVFIECKDYNGPVPVSDIEEFYAKTNQISGVNVKAFFFTTSSIQESGLNFANSVGMGLVRWLDDDSLAWLIECTNKELRTNYSTATSTNVLNALINEHFVSTKRDVFAYANGVGSYEIKDIIPYLFNTELLLDSV